MSTPQLMDAFGFDADDLQANREDHLTYAQRERVVETYRQYRRGIMPTLGLIGGIMVVGTIFVLLSGQTTMKELTQGLPIALPLVIGLVIVTGLGSKVLTSDLRNARMRVTEGQAKLLPGQYRGTPYYRVRVGRKTFNLTNERQFNAFRGGETYRVYYVRYWPDIMLSVNEGEKMS